ncbi:hypothetical protein B0H16DRAFT_1228463, partial [Mycena metata]
FPELPVELVHEIIATAWHMPLSPSERIILMRSSALVNSTWADTFDLIASRDVYIPSAAFSQHFIQRLRGTPAVAGVSSSFISRLLARFCKTSKLAIVTRSANLACQSLTIQLLNVCVHPDKYARTHLPMGAVLDELLETLDARSLAPNLRRLSIEYVDIGFDVGFEDIFRRDGLAALPAQVTHLDLRYSFSPSMPGWLTKSLRDKQERQRHVQWVLPSITHLTVAGAAKNTIHDMSRVCPHAQVLGID